MRSIFLKHESYSDVMLALSKADTELEYKRLIWERMKQNGMTRDAEISFRHHCKVVGFVLPDETKKAPPLAKDTQGRASSRLLTDAARHELRQSKIVGDVVGDVE